MLSFRRSQPFQMEFCSTNQNTKVGHCSSVTHLRNDCLRTVPYYTQSIILSLSPRLAPEDTDGAPASTQLTNATKPTWYYVHRRFYNHTLLLASAEVPIGQYWLAVDGTYDPNVSAVMEEREGDDAYPLRVVRRTTMSPSLRCSKQRSRHLSHANVQ